jgi:ABC-type lipoprotein release transport system permease subunit
VLKAFGWTGRRIRIILSAEMGLVCLAGLAAGTAVGLLVSPFIGARLRDVVGPSVVGDLVIPVPLLLAGNVAVLGFFLVVVWAVVGRAARRPVVTILGGV